MVLYPLALVTNQASFGPQLACELSDNIPLLATSSSLFLKTKGSHYRLHRTAVDQQGQGKTLIAIVGFVFKR